MLAYVFWHWPNADIDNASYRKLLQNFHETLNANAPRGFLRSVVFSLSQLPFLETSQGGFEDWYLLEDSASLDSINHAAVSGACEEPHNLVARKAADGTAGLYRPRSGAEVLTSARYATWFAKPASLSYQNFYSMLTPMASASGVGLWQRQMTLGPTTEFAIYSVASLPLPDITPTKTIELQPVWPTRSV
jgi:hypothetical protein